MYENNEILKFEDTDWRKEVFMSFANDLTSEDPKFPCVFGSSGFVKNQIRYDFLQGVTDVDIAQLCQSLRSYVQIGRELGAYTSFVAFFNADRSKTISEYEEMFWTVLNKLHKCDTESWPDCIPLDMKDPKWEFSFAGEPIFVVCNTPAHQLRNSRKSQTFMLTFQPRWVFERVTQQQIMHVRELLDKYDDIPKYPYLGTYGDVHNQSWLQYFIPDTNEIESKGCPFHHKL